MLNNHYLLTVTFQLRITARDTSSSPQTATATVTIAVNRNTRPFFLNQGQYTFSPSEAVDVYDSLFQVSASDPDSSVSVRILILVLIFMDWHLMRISKFTEMLYLLVLKDHEKLV